MMCLYFLKGSSGFIKIGRSSNFDKRLSEITWGTTDEHVAVVKVFYGEDEYIRTRERELHLALAADNFKREWFHDTKDTDATQHTRQKTNLALGNDRRVRRG